MKHMESFLKQIPPHGLKSVPRYHAVTYRGITAVYSTYSKSTFLLDADTLATFNYFKIVKTASDIKTYVMAAASHLRQGQVEIIQDLIKKKLVVAADRTQDHYYKRLRRNNLSEFNVCILYILTTLNCNMNCPYCYILSKGTNHGVLMDASKLKRLLDAAIDTCDSLGQIVFYGGEPLLNWKCIESVLKHLKKRHPAIRTVLYTNGTLLDRAKICVLNKAGTQIRISVDGFQREHEANRPLLAPEEGNYSKLLATVEMLCRMGVPYIANMTLTDRNVDTFSDFALWFSSKYKPSAINVNPARDMQPGGSYLLKFDKVDRKAIADGLWKIYKKANVPYSYNSISKQDIMSGDLNGKSCAAYGYQAVIAPDLRVGVCQGYVQSNKAHFVPFSFDKEPLSHCLRRHFGDWLQRGPLSNDHCKGCKFILTCIGGCAFASDVCANDFFKPVDLHCMNVKLAVSHFLKAAADEYKNELL